jgi:ribonuclease HII
MTAGTISLKPSLKVERALQRAGHRLIAGMDEVGRGALAGPVSVGVVVVDDACRSAPVGVKDSKLLSPQVRERLVPRIHRWATAYAVGHASPGEIDQYGIMVALRFAGTRAITELSRGSVIPDLIILDGNYDWLTDPGRVGLLGLLEGGAAGVVPVVPVTTIVKADMSCSSVAAASVLAKVERDAMMVKLAVDVPQYAWELNKGYCAPEHFAALQLHGPSVHHRRSWRLPGVNGAGDVDGAEAMADALLEDALIADAPPADAMMAHAVTPDAAADAVMDAVMDDDGAVRTERGGRR